MKALNDNIAAILARLNGQELISLWLLTEIVEKLSLGMNISDVLANLESEGASYALVKEIAILLENKGGAICEAD